MNKSRIMWVENKNGDGIVGSVRIGRVTYSKSGKSVYYKGKRLETLSGKGFKANYFEVSSGDYYWISGCRKDGKDALYNTNVEIDDDVRVEYWTKIRNKPENVKAKKFRAKGKY